jgi:hypothetical protein
MDHPNCVQWESLNGFPNKGRVQFSDDCDVKLVGGIKYSLISCITLSCLVLSCLVLSCLVLSCLVLSCLVLSCLVLPCLVLSSLVLSCLVLSCLVLSCLVLPCLALSCLVLSCLVLSVQEHPFSALSFSLNLFHLLPPPLRILIRFVPHLPAFILPPIFITQRLI